MLISSVSFGHKYQIGCLRKLTFLQWELEFKQSSFSHIGRVLRNPLGVTDRALFRFSLMLCSPHPFRGAFRAMVVVTRMTLLLLLTNKNLLWRWYKRPFHGAHKRVMRGNFAGSVAKKLVLTFSVRGVTDSLRACSGEI